MPATGAEQERRRVVVQLVLAAIFLVEGDRAANGIVEILLPIDDVVPGGRVGVLQVGHEDLGAGVERVDHHLAVARTGDLDAAVVQGRPGRRDRPVPLADLLGLVEKS